MLAVSQVCGELRLPTVSAHDDEARCSPCAAFAFACFLPSGYGGDMTVEAIKDAIAALPTEDRHSLALWLNGLEYDDWDKQMAEDFAPGGRGWALVDRVMREVAEGKTKSIAEGRTLAKASRELPQR